MQVIFTGDNVVDRLKIAICDDESRFLALFSSRVEGLLNDIGVKCHLTSYNSPARLIDAINDGCYFDMIFLDIDMPKMRGDVLAEKLQRLTSGYRLIFVSNLKQEVYRTFQYHPSGFIVKESIDATLRVELYRIVREIQDERENKEQFVTIDENQGNERVLLSVVTRDILYFENLKKSLFIGIVPQRRYRLRNMTFEQVCKRYGNKGFIQTHRSILVNIRHIYAIRSEEIELDNGEFLSLSRRKRKIVLDAVAEHINTKYD